MTPGRTARNHLRVLAATHGIGARRVDEVIQMTGLETVADKRVKGFSLGMGQRLGIATALLGDPATLVMDGPVNGLDPDGVLWVRNLARHFAAEGRTVLLSSHLMSEVQLTADRVVVIGRGRILADASISDLTAQAASGTISVRTSDDARLAEIVTAEGGTTEATDSGTVVTGLEPPRIAALAVGAGLDLHELVRTSATLEEAYLHLTADSVEHHADQEGAVR